MGKSKKTRNPIFYKETVKCWFLVSTEIKRKYPIGAEVSNKGVHFRIFAADHAKASLILENKNSEPTYHKMVKEKGGYFSLFVPALKEGSLYRFRLGNKENWLPDPASRFQPHGPNGPSLTVNPHYKWTDKEWKGLSMPGQIIYEMHIGTFTEEGTYAGAKKQLKRLSDLGITVIEIMPLNDFPGHFGWGYDGVNLFAPTHLYGSPSDLKDFINEAHKLGIGVILDIVYNHFGPEHSTIAEFTKRYLNESHTTEWGSAINFDDDSVSEFFLTNARYWIEEYHFDGLRVDATPWFFCDKGEHFLSKLTKVARKSAKKKSIIIVGEDETQNNTLLKPHSQKGYGFDALWNDDFHHAAMVKLKGKREAYYTDYKGQPNEFVSCCKYGFLYQGQYYSWQKKGRGSPSLFFPPESMIVFLENHDQVANSGHGLRLHQSTNYGVYKAFTALLLLGPNTPMLFQGQEFGSEKPFYYFADHSEDLNEKVFEGRKKFLSQFPQLENEGLNIILKPSDPKNFLACKLNFNEANQEIYSLHKDLIHLRKNDPVLRKTSKKYEASILGENSLLLRYFDEEEGDRMLIVNLGIEEILNPSPNPLLAPPEGFKWKIVWSSESPVYGGDGTAPLNVPHWKLIGFSSQLLKAVKPSKKKLAKH